MPRAAASLNRPLRVPMQPPRFASYPSSSNQPRQVAPGCFSTLAVFPRLLPALAETFRKRRDGTRLIHSLEGATARRLISRRRTPDGRLEQRLHGEPPHRARILREVSCGCVARLVSQAFRECQVDQTDRWGLFRQVGLKDGAVGSGCRSRRRGGRVKHRQRQRNQKPARSRRQDRPSARCWSHSHGIR